MSSTAQKCCQYSNGQWGKDGKSLVISMAHSKFQWSGHNFQGPRKVESHAPAVVKHHCFSMWEKTILASTALNSTKM
eukprot:5032647-Ditylum_brightwellii.AAC.1